jgi:hypothetical protein
LVTDSMQRREVLSLPRNIRPDSVKKNEIKNSKKHLNEAV